MPLQSTSGTASYDAFGGGVAAVPKYIEEYFSTFLFTGNASTQTITNGIDLAGKGGLVWTKNRTNAYDNYLYDTARGVNKVLLSNNTIDQQSLANTLTAFNSTGFTLGNSDYGNITNGAAAVSWSWAKAPKFFDVVTFTKSSSPQTISHNLGSTPGCIFIKRTDSTGGWLVAHRGYTGGITAGYTLLNTTDAFTSNANAVTAADSTTFTLGSAVVSGDFVAYLFAHNAGGFGLTGTDNVISCGSFDANNGEVINLGYEPQWLLYKDSSSTSNWRIADTMRGFTNLSGTNAQTIKQLSPNTSSAESDNSGPVLTSTGFTWNQSGGGNVHIYIAIRRGPMKVPTSGTSVFTPISNTSPATGCLTDMVIARQPTGTQTTWNISRLTNAFLQTNTTAAESANASYLNFDTMSGVVNAGFLSNSNSIWWTFRRAPSFFDEVCYTGTGVAGRTVTHNLTVAPELIIVKSRSLAGEQWPVYASPITVLNVLQLNTTIAATTYSDYWNNTAPTSSVFSVGSTSAINQSAATYVAYLFATCAGVSKVGSYTGTGTTLQVNCGFTGGARFVLIKRTDSTGDWYVWDSARGIVAGNDPYLLLNSTAAEVTSTDYIDTYSAGFEISSTAPAAINASGGSFMFLAVA